MPRRRPGRGLSPRPAASHAARPERPPCLLPAGSPLRRGQRPRWCRRRGWHLRRCGWGWGKEGGVEVWRGGGLGGAAGGGGVPARPSTTSILLTSKAPRGCRPPGQPGGLSGRPGRRAGRRCGGEAGGWGGGRHVGIASAARGAPHAPSPTPPLPHMRWVRASPSPSKVARDASISCTWGGRAGVGAARRVGDCTAPPTRPQGARTVGGVANDGGAGRVRRCGARSPARPATSGACDARGGRRSPERGRARPRGPCSCHARAQHHPPSTGRLLDRRAEPYGRRPCPT